MNNLKPGDKIAFLTFLRIGEKKVGRTDTMGVFLCKCGKEFSTRIASVINGKTKACGCYNKEYHSLPKINYKKGDQIGVLTFLNRVAGKPERPKANFLCPCGKEFVTRIDMAKGLETKSCGCMSNQLIAEASRNRPRQFFKRPPNKMLPHLTEEIKARFWSKVATTDNPDSCWKWLATGAYGGFRIGRKMYMAHRIAYFLIKGEDPGAMELLHSCDNPKCCNPAHLSPGTHLDNMKDMAKKGRAYNGRKERTKLNNIKIN